MLRLQRCHALANHTVKDHCKATNKSKQKFEEKNFSGHIILSSSISRFESGLKFFSVWAMLTLLFVSCGYLASNPPNPIHIRALAYAFTHVHFMVVCSVCFVCLYGMSLCVCLSLCVHCLVECECRSSVFVFILQASQRKVIQYETVSTIDTQSERYPQHMCRVY